jgi:hypothetical protein
LAVDQLNGGTISTIEGGSTTDDRISPIEVQGPFDIEKHRGVLTFVLVGLLSVVIIGHYVCLLVLEWNGKKTEGVTTAFTTALPVISGLVGAAIAYYFTRREVQNPPIYKKPQGP